MPKSRKVVPQRRKFMPLEFAVMVKWHSFMNECLSFMKQRHTFMKLRHAFMTFMLAFMKLRDAFMKQSLAFMNANLASLEASDPFLMRKGAAMFGHLAFDRTNVAAVVARLGPLLHHLEFANACRTIVTRMPTSVPLAIPFGSARHNVRALGRSATLASVGLLGQFTFAAVVGRSGGWFVAFGMKSTRSAAPRLGNADLTRSMG